MICVSVILAATVLTTSVPPTVGVGGAGDGKLVGREVGEVDRRGGTDSEEHYCR